MIPLIGRSGRMHKKTGNHILKEPSLQRFELLRWMLNCSRAAGALRNRVRLIGMRCAARDGFDERRLESEIGSHLLDNHLAARAASMSALASGIVSKTDV